MGRFGFRSFRLSTDGYEDYQRPQDDAARAKTLRCSEINTGGFGLAPCRVSLQTLHPAACARLQGFRGAHGANAISKASYLTSLFDVRTRFVLWWLLREPWVWVSRAKVASVFFARVR